MTRRKNTENCSCSCTRYTDSGAVDTGPEHLELIWPWVSVLFVIKVSPQQVQSHFYEIREILTFFILRRNQHKQNDPTPSGLLLNYRIERGHFKKSKQTVIWRFLMGVCAGGPAKCTSRRRCRVWRPPRPLPTMRRPRTVPDLSECTIACSL